MFLRAQWVKLYTWWSCDFLEWTWAAVFSETLRNKGTHSRCLVLSESQTGIRSQTADTWAPRIQTRFWHTLPCPRLQGLRQKQSPVSSRTKDAGVLRPVPVESRRPPSNHGPKGKPHRPRPVTGCGSTWWRGADDHSPRKVPPLLTWPRIRDDYVCSWSENTVNTASRDWVHTNVSSTSMGSNR